LIIYGIIFYVHRFVRSFLQFFSMNLVTKTAAMQTIELADRSDRSRATSISYSEREQARGGRDNEDDEDQEQELASKILFI